MKRFLSIMTVLAVLALMGACAAPIIPSPTETAVHTTPSADSFAATEAATTPSAVPVETTPKETTPAETTPTETTPKETTPPETTPTETVPPEEQTHSDLYVSGVSQSDMIRYFNEVVLSTEYATGSGNASLVQKWQYSIAYRIYGEPTEEDLAVLNNTFAQLNSIPGFPGFYEAAEHQGEDLSISFLDYDAFNQAFSDFLHGEISDGAVQFWYYTSSNMIYSGRIGYRTDISQEVRNSVIVEEVINLLGINDTTLRSDSIVYQYGSYTTTLSAVDWAIIKLLYHPDIQCGMNATACQTVLKKLYY